MIETVATVFLLGMMAAFAVSALLVNEGAHAQRRRLRNAETPDSSGRITIPVEEAAGEKDEIPAGDRRLPVGDFLFGALFLRGSEPLPFSELADAAAGSGMSVAQVLAWVERAEAGGLIERLSDEAPDGQPAVRLTEAGVDVARNNRRGARTRVAAQSDESSAIGS